LRLDYKLGIGKNWGDGEKKKKKVHKGDETSRGGKRGDRLGTQERGRPNQTWFQLTGKKK